MDASGAVGSNPVPPDGQCRIRTDDLLGVNEALSQLS